MRQINIFIAGSKTLKAYRERLVVWSNTKNYDYRKRDIGIQLNMYSFKEVGDDQDVYNTVITEESDIIFFLVEGKIGEKTKEELRKAKEGFNKRKRPEIWVFTKDLEEGVDTYLEGALGRKFSIDFDSADNLVIMVNECVDKYVSKMGKESGEENRLSYDKDVRREAHKTDYAFTSSSSSPSKKGWSKDAVLGLACLLAGLIIGICCYMGYVNNKAERHMLLISGGGSVANFIENKPESKIPSLADYPNGYFLHLPTKSAWKMLVEEVVSLQDTRKYYPICISAAEATDNDFCSAQISKQMFLDSAIVVSCKMGEDSLAVYVQKGCKFLKDNAECLYTNHISVPQLKELVESKKMNVYSTSLESGTRAGYCQVLNIDNDKFNEYLAGQFSEYSPISSVSKDNKPYLLLGSQCYQMNAVRDDVMRLTVDTKFIKPMLIYFMAYRVSHDIYKIPKETIEFIHHLKLNSLDDYISSEGTIKIKNHDHVIYGEADLVKNHTR